MKPSDSTLFVIAFSMLASACAGSSDRYPSLAIRDAERVEGQFTPPSSGQTEPIRAVASESEIEALVAQATASHREFLSARSQTLSLVNAARGRSVETSARQRALVSLASLSALRSETALPLGNLDLLMVEARTTFAPTQEIDAAQTRVSSFVAEQDAALDELWRMMGR